jgi:tripartite-type tricarboxylate transporter receptor subunit TctC
MLPRPQPLVGFAADDRHFRSNPSFFRKLHRSFMTECPKLLENRFQVQSRRSAEKEPGEQSMMTRRHLLSASAAGLALTATGLIAPGYAEPGGKTVRILVGFPPGGPNDVIARLLSGEMKGYASSVIVENRSGAGGRVAIEALKTAAPDGSTLILTPKAPMTLYPHVYKTLRYDPLRDFVPVTTICEAPFLLTVGPKVSADVNTLADFIAWCRINPKQATYGSPGSGSPLHFTGVQLAHAAGFDYIHVPYQGQAPAIQDLLGGQIASSILTIDTPLPHVLSGSIRALATTGSRRSTFLAEVPTIRELGFPALEGAELLGIYVPAATPSDSVEKLDDSIRAALKAKQVRDGLAKLSLEISIISQKDFARLIKLDFERWAAIVEASGFAAQD